MFGPFINFSKYIRSPRRVILFMMILARYFQFCRQGIFMAKLDFPIASTMFDMPIVFSFKLKILIKPFQGQFYLNKTVENYFVEITHTGLFVKGSVAQYIAFTMIRRTYEQ